MTEDYELKKARHLVNHKGTIFSYLIRLNMSDKLVNDKIFSHRDRFQR